MAAHQQRARVLCSITFAHQFCPDAASSAEFSNLFKEVIMHIKEEREARREFIDLQATLQGRIDIGQAIGNREGEFLYRCCTRLADVVSTNTNRVPPGHIACAKLDSISYEAQ